MDYLFIVAIALIFMGLGIIVGIMLNTKFVADDRAIMQELHRVEATRTWEESGETRGDLIRTIRRIHGRLTNG